METIIILAVVIVSAILCFAIKHYRETQTDNNAIHGNNESTHSNTQENNANHLTAETDYTGMKPRELCKALLRDLNCKVVEDEEDKERMEFNFQGETFCLIATDDCLFATVYDFSWGSITLDDIDELSRLRKAINNVNFRFGGLCVAYTIDTERNHMAVHTKRQFLVTPEIPNILDYMTAMLTGFFEVQRALTHELDRLRQEKNKE